MGQGTHCTRAMRNVLVGRPWGHQVEVEEGRRKRWKLFPRDRQGWAQQCWALWHLPTLVFSSVHLQVCRCGPILPAAQGIHSN